MLSLRYNVNGKKGKQWSHGENYKQRTRSVACMTAVSPRPSCETFLWWGARRDGCMSWLRTRQSFKKTWEVKKLALTIINSVFSTVKWWSSFFKNFAQKVRGTGLLAPLPPTPTALIYTIESMVCCLRLPNMVSATWLWGISRGIGANILNE